MLFSFHEEIEFGLVKMRGEEEKKREEEKRGEEWSGEERRRRGDERRGEERRGEERRGSRKNKYENLIYILLRRMSCYIIL